MIHHINTQEKLENEKCSIPIYNEKLDFSRLKISLYSINNLRFQSIQSIPGLICIKRESNTNKFQLLVC
jgi:hypothetical protein